MTIYILIITYERWKIKSNMNDELMWRMLSCMEQHPKIYMNKPIGIQCPNHLHYVCKNWKVLPGLNKRCMEPSMVLFIVIILWYLLNKENVSIHFHMEKHGQLKYFLALEVSSTSRAISFHHQKNTWKICSQTKYFNNKT